MSDSVTTSENPPARQTLLERVGQFFFRFRNAAFPLVLVPLAIIFGPKYFLGSEVSDHWLDALGVLIALSGEGLRIAVIGYAYIRRGGRKKRVYADSLVTEGFFNHSRNPLYLGNMLVVVGLVIIHNDLWLYLLALPFFFIAYSAIIAAEESYLRQHFGHQFDDYCRRVNRWWVNPRGLRRSLAGMRFNWRRVIVKEYGTMATLGASIILLLAYQTLVHHAYFQRWIYLTVLWSLLGLLGLGWGAARYLKKTRRLTGDPVEPNASETSSSAGGIS